MTQKEIILNHLIENPNGITSLEAFRDYGISRLSDVVFKLKRDRHHIVTKIVKVPNRRGEPCFVARYVLEVHNEA